MRKRPLIWQIGDVMKIYLTPEIEIINISDSDVVTTSPGLILPEDEW